MSKCLSILLFLFVSFSCNGIGKKVDEQNKRLFEHSDLNFGSNEREDVIAELKRLKQILSSSDAEKIAGIFEFPIQQNVLPVYIEDDSFNNELENNGNNISKQMFVKHFDEISGSIGLVDINRLFQNILIDSLLHKDHLQIEAVDERQPCYNNYSLDMTAESIFLKITSNVNMTFKNSSLSQNDIPKNSSEFCEHTITWFFKISSGKLIFQNISGAG